ncbi:MAG: type II toxin-antitoxin system Phd/YefM family antitoxin [Oscillochloris sp.]|nr:type II toxin-antitoxin system Phd/YefM family antitoxin [Oscillochloris sp.]
MPSRGTMNLNVDLQRGVVPISKAASSLAALIKRANLTGQPVIVTQKGYPTGVLLPVELFTSLKDLTIESQGSDEPATSEAVPELSVEVPEVAAVAEVDTEDTAPKPRRAVSRRRKAQVPVEADV